MLLMKNAMEYYTALAREAARSGRMPEKKDLAQLMELIRQELFVSGASYLMDAACFSCRYYFSNHRMPLCKYEPEFFTVPHVCRRVELPVFDAWWIILLLGAYMPGGTLPPDTEKLLPYFFGDFIPKNPNVGEWYRALRSIDTGVGAARKRTYEPFGAEHKKADAAPALSADEKAALLNEVRRQAEEEARRITGAARAQAEEESRGITDAARAQAEQITARAAAAAEEKLAAARTRCAALAEERREQENAEERQLLLQGFAEVRAALQPANETLKRLEDTVYESAAKKAYRQLTELYDLIDDLRTAASAAARETGDEAQENTAYNMEALQDMLAEYLSSYGITRLISAPGEPFSPKLHAAQGTPQFDPRNAVIRRSLKPGFLWGEQALRKEQVEV